MAPVNGRLSRRGFLGILGAAVAGAAIVPTTLGAATGPTVAPALAFHKDAFAFAMAPLNDWTSYPPLRKGDIVQIAGVYSDNWK